VSEEVDNIIKDAIDNTISGKDYEEKNVPQWINLICESVMEKLIKKTLPYKFMGSLLNYLFAYLIFIVNCLIM
jgi:hypothetical protein